MTTHNRSPVFYFGLLLLGIFCASTSFLFIRESTEPPVMLAAQRLLLTVLILQPVFWRDYHKHCSGSLPRLLRDTFWPGVVLALHFISWIIGVRMTSAANATLIVNLVPLVMPVFMLVMFSERITGRELFATALALSAMVILSANDFHLDAAHFKGDVICFFSMILFALYLALGRNSARLPSIWLYMVPLYFIAGLICMGIALFYSSPFHVYEPYNLTMIVLLALVPTVAGHTLLNFSMQKFRGQTVSILNMTQFIFAGIMAYFFYQEVPSAAFYMAAVMLAASIFWLSPTHRKSP
ncbi:DMT family transporter [Granulosicoccaceae sp. 1_MG-2023]|nr:DMT family transporter [Granulosicoccaceae sp. 1_MG-2023]